MPRPLCGDKLQPTDVMEKFSVLTWLVLQMAGINLCCDINGMFILGWAVRVARHKEKAKRNRLQEGERRGVKLP